MSTVLKKVGKQASIYMAGVILNRLASFIMLPIYTSFLTPGDYGVLEMLSVTVEVIGMIGLVGLSSGVFKFHAEYEEAGDKREVLSTATLGIMGLTSVIASVGILASPLLSEVVLGSAGRPLYFRLFFLIFLLQQWEVVPMLLLRIQDRAWAFVGVGVARLVSMLTLNVWLVVYEGWGVVGVLTSNVATSMVTSLLLLLYMFRTVGRGFSRPKILRMVRYGAPMVLWFLGNFALVFSDRYFLQAYWGVGVVGLYSLGYRFVSLLSSVVFVPFQNVWEPERFRLAKLGQDSQEASDTFRQVFTYLNFGLAFAALGLAVFTREVLMVMADPAFHAAYTIVPVLLAAQIIYHWAPFANLGLLLEERTDTLGRLAVVAAGVVILANFLLVPRFGMYGAALASLLAYGTRFILVLRWSQRRFRIRYDWLRVGVTYAIVTGAVLLKFSLTSLALLPSLAVATGIMAGSGLTVFVLVLTPDERSFAKAHARRLLPRGLLGDQTTDAGGGHTL